MQRRSTSKLNLLSLRRQYTHPHELYDALRAHDSCYFDESSQSWLVTGHQIVSAILDDERFISGLSDTTTMPSPHMSPIHKQMLFLDGEAHRRAQDVMLRPLAHMVKRMPDTIRRIVQQALSTVLAKGEMEVVSEFASPISLFTIAHVLGMPVQDHAELLQLERWSDTFGDVTSGYLRGNMQDIQDLESYFKNLIAYKKHHPSDDLLSAFLEAKDVFPTEEDLIANCMMVFAAGRITTKKLLGNGISLLQPQWKQFQSTFQKNTRFARQLGEELLRAITPTRYLIREAREEVDLSSFTSAHHFIHHGQRVLLFLEAADYDPAVFEHPSQFQPERRPNKHIAFGYGPHQCPGATLARVEIQIALEELLMLSSLRPKPDTSPVWNPNPNLGGYLSNHVAFDA
jgi:cytochrome P450